MNPGPTSNSTPMSPSRGVIRLLRADGTDQTEPQIAAALSAARDGDTVWVDLVAPSSVELDKVAERLAPGVDLHPLVVEDVFDTLRRPKIDRYDDHLFLDLAYVGLLNKSSLEGEQVVVHSVAAIIYKHRLITIRRHAPGSEEGAVELDRLLNAWRGAEPERRDGAGIIIHALLDQAVDSIVSVAEVLDDQVDQLEEDVIGAGVRRRDIQGRAFTLRKSAALVRRVAMPTREVTAQVVRRDGRGFLSDQVADENVPYLHDVGDHIVRVSESLDAMRDELTSVLELNMSMQDSELNQVMKKLSAWAAIIAIPTAITGYFGQNVPYPGFSQEWGFWVSCLLILLGGIGLWWWFRRLEWL